MPELPEVETIKRGLTSHIIKQDIIDVDVRNLNSFQGRVGQVIGKKITGVQRKGKNLIVELSNGALLIHLKMTGQLIYIPSSKNYHVVGGHPDKNYSLTLPHKHSHIIFKLSSGTLYFNDLRKFGWIKYIDDVEQVKQHLVHLGPEYADPEYTKDYLINKLANKNTSIKQVLLDQTIIAGLGNIYADESLYLSGIHPLRNSSSLTIPEIDKLFAAIPKVLEDAISHGGTTMKDFRHTDGSLGSYLVVAKVYGLEGKNCRNCGNKIKRIKIAGRSSHFCETCQQ